MRDRMTHHLTRERIELEVDRARRPFLVVCGMLVLGVVALAVLLVRLGVPLPGEDRYEIRIAVDDARGLTAGASEVRLSGVVVGEVTGVRRDGRRALVTARLEPRHGDVYRDARVRISPKTPLEDMYLGIEDRGTPGAGALGEGEPLQAARTRTPVEFAEVLDVFNADVRPQMARAITGLGRGLSDRGEQLRAALREFAPFLAAAQRLTRVITDRERQTRRLVHNFAALSDELADRDEDLQVLVRAGAGSLDQLAAAEQPLSRTIEALPGVLRRMPRSLGAVRASADELDRTLVALLPAAQALPAGLAAVQDLAPDLASGAAALRRPLEPLRSVARSLPVLARDLNEGIATLRPQAPRLDRVTADVVPCKLAVQKFFHWTISVGKFYDVRGAALRGQPIFSTNAAAGLAPDAGLTSSPSCAKGVPHK